MEKTDKKGLSLEQADKIMGRLIIGIDKVDRLLGFIPDLHPIPFTERDLEIHANEGHRLYFEIPHTNDGQPINIEMLAKIAYKKGNWIGQNEYLFWLNQFNDDGSVKSNAWFCNDQLVMSATPGFGWKIASEEVIPETTYLNYIDQTDVLIDYHKKLYKSRLPEHCKIAISQWEAKRLALRELLKSGSNDAICKELIKAKITALVRESFVSIEYRRLLICETEGRKILKCHWNWSSTRSSSGKFVSVGDISDDGAIVLNYAPGNRYGDIGASFSRSV